MNEIPKGWRTFLASFFYGLTAGILYFPILIVIFFQYMFYFFIQPNHYENEDYTFYALNKSVKDNYYKMFK